MSHFYRKENSELTESIGIHTYNDEEIYAAWGYLKDPHCSFNAVKKNKAEWYPAINGCPIIKLIVEDDKTSGFSVKTIDGEKIIKFL